MKQKRACRILIPLACALLAGCAADTTQGVQSAGTTETVMTAQGTAPEAGATETTTAPANTTETTAPAGADAKTAVAGDRVSETVEDGTDLNIHAAGVYEISGSAKNASIIVDASDSDAVEIVLNNVNITNDDFPCIYVKNADKVLVTSADNSNNTLAVTGTFRADGNTNTDAVIFSRDDLTLDGTGSIAVTSTDNGITGKDDLVIAGGTLTVDCSSDALEVNNSIEVHDGDITIVTKKDGIHAEKSEDDTLGSVLVAGGRLDITAGDDAVHGTTTVRIDGGEMKLSAAEGIEGTVIEINGGTIDIEASDDGINAAKKSTFVATPSFTMNDGTLTIVMGAGDTDAIDSNGDLTINGGTIDITAQSAFDYVGNGAMNGGKITVNGTEVTSLTNRMTGGRGGMMPGDGSGEGASFDGRGGFGGRGGRGGHGGFPGDGQTPPEPPQDGTFPGRGARPDAGSTATDDATSGGSGV